MLVLQLHLSNPIGIQPHESRSLGQRHRQQSLQPGDSTLRNQLPVDGPIDPNCSWGNADDQSPLREQSAASNAGDPPELVAIAKNVRSVLGWTPRFDDLDTIVSTSLAWERKIADQDSTAYWAA